MNIYFNPLLNTTLPSAIVNLKGQQIEINEPWCSMLGRPRSQLVGELLPFIKDLKYNHSLEKIYNEINKKQKFTCEYRISRPIGSSLWLKFNLVPQLDQFNNIVGYFCFIEDINEEKLTKHRINQLLASNEIGTWELLLDKNIFIADKFCFSLLGYGDQSNPSVKEWLKIVHPEDIPIVKEVFKKHLNKEIESFNVIYRVNLNNQERYIHTKGKIVKNLKDEQPRMLGLIHDVTNYKLMENEIKDQKIFFKSILDSIPHPLFVKDPENNLNLSFCNKNTELIFGTQKIGERTTFQDDKDLETDLEAIKKNLLLTIPEQEVKVGAENRTFCIKKTPLKKNGKTLVLNLYLDITEKISDQRRLISNAKMATVGQMVGSIAHEINNPLSLISIMAGQLKRTLSSETPDLEKAIASVNKIEKTTLRIGKIIKGLKSISRNGENDPLEKTQLTTIIDETLELCKHNLDKSGVSINVSNFTTEINVDCRSTEISQVLLNLIKNAQDALLNCEKKEISIEITKSKQFVFIAVQDSGPGVPESLREKIMSPFFTTKTPDLGTGLGLSISRQIMLNHGGDLYLDHSTSASCFKLILPIIA